MLQIQTKSMTFEEFIEWCPDDGPCYELRRGVVIEMQPRGKHEEVISFLSGELFLEVRRLQLPCLFPRQALIKLPEKDTGYRPDILIVEQNALATEPLWERASTLTKGETVRLVVEVVSTNWRDDYNKLSDYEALGIPEYWIVDYLGLGGRRYIGSPKQPTLTICQLVDEEYQLQQFQGDEKIISDTFPELSLTAEQMFNNMSYAHFNL